jgi:hypothetical protein
MTQNRHEPFEELISASLAGDLTADERERLDRHLDACAQCRSTLAAFADQRRIIAGLRHVPAPRDLGARVRAGIEQRELPWWRRPPAIFAGVGGGLAVVAGALLALVLINGDATEPPVGANSPTPSVASQPSGTPLPTLPPASPPPVASATAPPSIVASPAETPVQPTPSPEPDVYVAVTGEFDNPAMTVVDAETDEPITEVAAPAGEPIAAEISPDGQWLAFIVVLGESGMNEVRVTRIADAPDPGVPIDPPTAVGDTVTLGRTIAGSPFLERLFWSPDSRYLAYTLADVDGGGTDAWMFEADAAEVRQLTDTGTAYAGSWAAGGSGSSLLWISVAGDEPASYLRMFHDDAGDIEPADPADSPFGAAQPVFQPILSPNGAFVIYWTGTMDRVGDEWLFRQGGTPVLAENRRLDDAADGFAFESTRPLFSDLTIGREAFTSAAISWGTDSNAYAVWDANWTGTPQSAPNEAPYPDQERVYFGHADDPRGLTQSHAIDAGDVPQGTFVVDVKVSPTGRHLVITAGRPRAGIGDRLRADLLLVTRNTGSVADEVERIRNGDDGWFGPAVFRPIEDAPAER